MHIVERLISLRRFRAVRELLLLTFGVDIPKQVVIGSDLTIQHRGLGIVITPNTTIGDRVSIYQHVTIGRAAVDGTDAEVGFVGLKIEDDVVLCAGSRILGGTGTLVVGQGSVVAANAVLTKSTGDWEIWAGVPARKISNRTRLPSTTGT